MTRPTPEPDPYAVLGVPRDASQADITAAYRRLVRSLHPDTHRADPERLTAVLAAYQVLRDPERRGSYDRSRPQRSGRFTEATIPVRVHHRPARQPDLRAGPVRRHTSRG